MQRFIESPELVPSDAQVIEHVWTKSNKDGSPDLRYKDNIRQPVVNYVSLVFTSQSGLCETYYVSNVDAAQIFSHELTNYLRMLNGEEVVPDAVPVPIPSPPVLPDTPPQSVISREYFDLLMGFLSDMKTMCSTLQEDNNFRESIKATKGCSDTDPKEFISYCITFDVARVFLELLGESVTKKSVEKSSLALIANALMNSSSPYSCTTYENFDDFVLDKNVAKFAKIFLDFGRTDPALNFIIGNNDCDPSVPRIQFAMPALLMSLESPHSDKYATVLCRLATVIAKTDGTVSKCEEEALKKIFEMVHNPMPVPAQDAAIMRAPTGNGTLDDVLRELELLVGLYSVKEEVRTLINFAKVQKERERLGLKNTEVSYHLVLTGSPGTGKTTVARIVSKIYNILGILKKGQLVETDKSGLIAEYLGQTPVKVNRLIDSALDGVLFIDEAYSLTDEHRDGYGKEAVATLIKRMEDDRERLIVMVAGYTEEMKTFIDSNSGLKSRFNKYIAFPDYTPKDLLEIFERQCKALEYVVENDARTKIEDLFQNAYDKRDRAFGNGRYVRNIFEKVCKRQANRIAGLPEINRESLVAIMAGDIPDE